MLDQLYCLRVLAVKNFICSIDECIEIRMLRWMCDHIRRDKIRCEDLRNLHGHVGVALKVGQDAERESEIARACKEEEYKCPNEEVQKVGSGRFKER